MMNDTPYENDNFKTVKLLAVRELLNKFQAISNPDKPSLTQLLNLALTDYITTADLRAEFQKLNNQ